jgi:hypothetical protein
MPPKRNRVDRVQCAAADRLNALSSTWGHQQHRGEHNLEAFYGVDELTLGVPGVPGVKV